VGTPTPALRARADLRQHLIERLTVPVKERDVRAGRNTTRIMEAGEGKPLVLVHGGNADAFMWSFVLEPLAKEHLVYAVDVPGFGASSKPRAPYTTAWYAKWMSSLFDALAIRRGHLVAASQMGPAAMRYAAGRPDRVAGLVAVGSTGLGKARLPRNFVSALAGYHLRPSRVRGWRVLEHLLDAKRLTPELREWLDLWMRYRTYVLSQPGGRRPFVYGRRAGLRPWSADQLRRVDVSSLFICGEEDRMFTRADTEAAAALMPRAQLWVVRGARHLPSLTHSQVTARAISEFLRRVG
jgi:pimeloyl-ACP methyl ester carboxylesterase